MKVILKVQKNGVNTLKDEILSHSNNSLKKIYLVAGNVKESGYQVLEECLIDLKAKKFIAFGIDKKNTTRSILENVLKYTKTVYVFNNNNEIEFSANILVFEYETKALVYTFAGDLTDGVLELNNTLYTVIEYDLASDYLAYNEYVSAFTNEIKQNYTKLTKELVEELVETKQIFTSKQYLHVLPSISELLGQNDEKQSVEDKKPEIPKVQIDDTDTFEIDLGDLPEVYLAPEMEEEKKIEENNESEEIETGAFGLDEYVEDKTSQDFEIEKNAIDMEAMVLEQEVVKIDVKKLAKNKNKQSEETKKTPNKKIDLSKVSNVIMELPTKPSKGKDVNKIKIPNYIKDMIPSFFKVMDDAKIVSTDIGEYKKAKIKLDVIDVNNKNKFSDSNASLNQKVGQTYIEFETASLTDVTYEENDIARIIKLSDDSYHIEIIPKEMDEYKLWKKLCTNDFRGSARKYGLM